MIDDTLSIVFTIYDAATDGGVFWTETQATVIVEKGIFSVLLGSVNPIPDTVFTGDVRYLGVKVEADPEMTPRKKIVSVAYAYKSEYADTAHYAEKASGIGGSGTANYIPKFTASTTLGNSSIYETGGRIGIGTTTPNAYTRLPVHGSGYYAGYFTSKLFEPRYKGHPLRIYRFREL